MMSPHTTVHVPKKKRKTLCQFSRPKTNAINGSEFVYHLLLTLTQMSPGFLLSFADIMLIPSAFPVSYLTALAVCGLKMSWPVIGYLLSVLYRILWGYPISWEMLISVLLCLSFGKLVRNRGNVIMLLFTFAALMPGLIVAMYAGTAQDFLMYFASMLLSMFSTPVLFRALTGLRDHKQLTCMDVQISMIFLGFLLLAGGTNLSLFSINLGLLFASAITCFLAMELGLASALSCGILAGLVLALQGAPVTFCVALSLGGFLASFAKEMDNHFVTCFVFLLGASLMLLLSGLYHNGNLLSVLVGALLVLLMPKLPAEKIREFLRYFHAVSGTNHDPYTADALQHWKKTVQEMSQTVPEPAMIAPRHDGAWWKQQLCCACPDRGECDVMHTQAAITRAEDVWRKRTSVDDEWQTVLEELRGLGCGRLYCLRGGMDQLRREQTIFEEQCRQARYQHDMLVTHLTALSGAAGKFAAATHSLTWWEEMYSRRIRRILSENAIPAALLYLRRAEGHVMAALEVYSAGEAARLQQELSQLLASVLQCELYISSIETDRIYFQEATPFSICLGRAMRGTDVHGQTGDCIYTGMLNGGRFIAVISDGMGQGEHAGYESSATVKLLRLCLEAGYTREQAITAVNGMMLLETQGERFATADLLTVDLWNGHANLDKLGAAGSWLLRGNTLVQLTGDALPIGIMETVESRTSLLRLKHGDRLLMMTDGIEDAFDTPKALESAIRRSLQQPDPNVAAEYLIQQAQRARSDNRTDDMTVIVMQITKRASVARKSA